MLPFNPTSETLRAGMAITLRWPDRCARVVIRSVRSHKRFRLLLLESCDTIDAAEMLVGAEVCVDAGQLPPAGPGEVYHYDLLGLRVETVDGQVLGVVEDVLTAGDSRHPSRPASNDVCVVRGPDREYLVPLIADVVRDIDVGAGKLVINLMPGLLD